MARISDSKITEILEQVKAEETEGAKITIKNGLFEYEDESHTQAVRIVNRIKTLIHQAAEEDKKARKERKA
jgi:hypothetical protein